MGGWLYVQYLEAPNSFYYLFLLPESAHTSTNLSCSLIISTIYILGHILLSQEARLRGYKLVIDRDHVVNKPNTILGTEQ